MANFPRVERGQRVTIAGRTGSGKSTLARWFLARSPGRWVILNPKHTKAYDSLADSNTVSGFDLKKIERSMQEHRFTVINPKSEQATAEIMDAFVLWLHQSYTHVGLCVDELYTLHSNGRAGEGLIGWLTRGRELKQSFLGLTQRPAWVSKFLLSESDYLGEMSLTLEADRKVMRDIIGSPEALVKLPPYVWLWYDMGDDELRKFGPVPSL